MHASGVPHRSAPSAFARYAARHPRRSLALAAIGAAIAVIVLVWAFAAIADAVPEDGWMVHTDRALTAFIQAHDTEWGERLFVLISDLGPPIVSVAALAAAGFFAWRRHWIRATTVLVCGGGGIVLNNVLKAIFHRGRPEVAVEFITRQSWSFPSGHAMDSITTYGILALFAAESMRHGWRRSAVLWGAALLIVAIGVSRVYLGVHYLSDVAGGWLAGGAWLIVCAAGYRYAARTVSAAPSVPRDRTG